MLDRWEAVGEIHDARAEGPVFSTFVGPEPDVWPVLEKETDIAGITTMIMLAFAFGAATSLAIMRLKIRKIR